MLILLLMDWSGLYLSVQSVMVSSTLRLSSNGAYAVTTDQECKYSVIWWWTISEHQFMIWYLLETDCKLCWRCNIPCLNKIILMQEQLCTLVLLLTRTFEITLMSTIFRRNFRLVDNPQRRYGWAVLHLTCVNSITIVNSKFSDNHCTSIAGISSIFTSRDQ